MNQILVTERLYITPDVKRKKKLYKIEFFLSVFLVCILSTYYVYAEYNRTKSEEVSQEILGSIDIARIEDTTTKNVDNDVIIVVLKEDQEMQQNVEAIPNNNNNRGSNISATFKSSNGKKYNTEAVLTIPKIDISYPVLTETSDELLEISLNKYWGPSPNEIGNYCIVGHNYRSGRMFGRLSEVKVGDTAQLEDLLGRIVTYKVYNKYVVKPTDTKCTSQLTNEKRELTLITCTNYGKERLVLKLREV